jgi:hypothetical protein
MAAPANASAAAGEIPRRAGAIARIDRCVIDYVHIAIDDATRLAYAEVLSDEKVTTAIASLRRAIALFRRHGLRPTAGHAGMRTDRRV